MKPFNLEKALAGAPVITRGGARVLQLHYFPTVDEIDCIYAAIEGEDTVTGYNKQGEFNVYSEEDSSYDLFMDVKLVKKYVGIRSRDYAPGVFQTTNAFNTKAQLQEVINNHENPAEFIIHEIEVEV